MPRKLVALSVLAVGGAAALLGGAPLAVHAQTAGPSQPAQTGSAKRQAVCGQVTELAGDHITIKPANGNAQRVSVGTTTRYVARSLAAAEAGLHEGSYARAVSTGGAAIAVQFGNDNFCAQAAGLRYTGTVVSSTPNSLTFRTQTDQITVNFTQATKFYVDGKLVQNPPAFQQGERVAVAAQRESDGSLNALRISVRTAAGSNLRYAGTVVGATPNSLTFRTQTDQLTVIFTQATRFYVNGKLEQNPPAFNSGEAVRVVAQRAGDGSLDALRIAVKTG